MKVQFLKLVVNVGHAGDIKEVSDSYARNFLITKGLAKMFTEIDAKTLENQKKKQEQQRVYKLANRNEIFAQLNGKSYTFSLPKNQTGKVYGSIGEKDIIEILIKEFPITLTKSDIDITGGHIKKGGKYDVFIKLGAGLAAKIIISAD